MATFNKRGYKAPKPKEEKKTPLPTFDDDDDDDMAFFKQLAE